MAVTETPPETVQASAKTAGSGTRSEPTGLAAILGTGDHKVIGRLYIATSLLFGLVIGVLGALFAYEGVDPGELDFFGANHAYPLFTLFRLGAVFLVGMPLVIGLALVVVPLQVGSSTVAFPRAAALSFWGWLLGSALLLGSYAVDGGPGGTSTTGVNLFVASMILVVVALLVAAICLATTVIALRTTGLLLSRIPMYSWSVLVASVMWLLTLPVLVGALVLSYVDVRHASGTLGGNAAIFGRFAWVLRNPQVYVVAIPVLGFTADVLATTARARLAGRPLIQGAIAGAGICGFGAVLATPSSAGIESPVVVALGLAAVLPVLAVLGLLGDLFRRGSFRLTTGAIYALCASILLLVATAAGALGSIPDMETAGTIYDLGVAHLALLAAITGALGGVHWWATKVGRAPAHEGLGRVVPLALLVSTLVASIPDLISGLTGEGVELAADWTGGISGLNTAVLVGSVTVVLALALAVASLLPIRRVLSQVSSDPWEGQTLEWLAPSPPPLANFDGPIPVVTSPEPLVDQREENR